MKGEKAELSVVPGLSCVQDDEHNGVQQETERLRHSVLISLLLIVVPCISTQHTHVVRYHYLLTGTIQRLLTGPRLSVAYHC